MKISKILKVGLILTYLVLGLTVSLWAIRTKTFTGPRLKSRETLRKPRGTSITKTLKIPQSFQVVDSKFRYVTVGNEVHLKVDVTFNKNVDLSSISLGNNFRMLRRNQAGFWVDVHKTHDSIQGFGKKVIWSSNEWAAEGALKLHLRGTIKSTGGDFLDCNGDGKAEGGYPPPYESSIFYSVL
ncbi:MAG: hypothetical protein JSW17_02590 [Candidatus Omnitrophota bacterium]|nr:MAG: hypothetical protein JSW17_02590 [Candidatus Omnitrophota bacterium]